MPRESNIWVKVSHEWAGFTASWIKGAECKNEGEFLTAVHFLGNKNIVVGSNQGTITLWNKRGKLDGWRFIKKGEVRHITSKGDQFLFVAGQNILVFDLLNYRDPSRTLVLPDSSPIVRMKVSPDQKKLVVFNEDGKALIFNIEDIERTDLYGKEIKPQKVLESVSGGALKAVGWNPNRYGTFTVGDDNQVRWVSDTGRLYDPFITLPQGCHITDLFWSNDGKQLAICYSTDLGGSRESRLVVYEYGGGKVRKLKETPPVDGSFFCGALSSGKTDIAVVVPELEQLQIFKDVFKRPTSSVQRVSSLSSTIR